MRTQLLVAEEDTPRLDIMAARMLFIGGTLQDVTVRSGFERLVDAVRAPLADDLSQIYIYPADCHGWQVGAT